MEIDVALVPAETRSWPARVSITVDELRASSTITAAFDLGCSELFVTRRLDAARRLAREHGSLLAGERRGIMPRGFDHNNSPSELARAGIAGRSIVLSTANGTAVLARLRRMPLVLVGCLLNADACARTAVAEAHRLGVGIGLVCAGVLGRFAFDDAVTTGVIIGHIEEALREDGEAARLTDAALAARRLAAAHPDLRAALEAAATGRRLHEIGAPEDIEYCARLNTTRTVPMLRTEAVGTALQLVPLSGHG